MPALALLTEAEAEDAILDYLSEISGPVPMWSVLNRLAELGTRSENREARTILRNTLTQLIQSGAVRRYHRRWQYGSGMGHPPLGKPRFRVDLVDAVRVCERDRRSTH
jgi:hypothetical protein